MCFGGVGGPGFAFAVTAETRQAAADRSDAVKTVRERRIAISDVQTKAPPRGAPLVGEPNR
jgi:hypothetical protein